MKLRSTLKTSERHSGLAVVEFAFIAPVMVFLILGMIEVSRAIQVRQVLGDAARAGCRMGIQSGYTNTNVTSAAKDILDDYLDINTSDPYKPSDYATLTIQVNGTTADVSTAKKGDYITVYVSIPASQVSWVTPRFITSGTNLIQSMTMVRQI